MHNPDYSQKDKLIQFEFTNKIVQNNDRRLSTIFYDKSQNKEKFYGIEVSANSKTNLNFNKFKIQPLFTSIVWIGQLFASQELSEISAFKTAEILKPHTIVLLHLSCYKMTKKDLNNYLTMANYSNILALRGDFVVDSQEFKHASDLVKEIRIIRGDTVSIAVGGYPDVHPEAISKEDDLKNLKIKVDAGADFIITQICFSSEKIKEFIRNCRSMGIKIPILPGIYIPNSFPSLKRMCSITKVRLPKDLWDTYEKLTNNDIEFRNLAIQNAINTINDLFTSGLDIYGIHFFTFNNFENVERTVNAVF